MENNSIVRKHIIFYGYVQGVGFRYRARHAADLYGCTGWVRNEWDGSVSMEIQGEESQIDQVILAIERGTYVRIVKMEVKTISVVEHDYGFRTRSILIGSSIGSWMMDLWQMGSYRNVGSLLSAIYWFSQV